MSGDCLPVEILEDVFKQLGGKELVKCRRVCRRWRAAVDGLRDAVWRDACRRSYSRPLQDTYDKAGISWREFYKSLYLWSKIGSAKVITKKVPLKNTKRFAILKNGTIGVPTLQKPCRSSDIRELSNCIIYYNLDTLEECNREVVDFDFGSYEENEHYIVVVDTANRLCVKPQVNKKHSFTVELDNFIHNHFILVKDKVYYLKVSKSNYPERIFNFLSIRNNEVEVKTTMLKFENPVEILSVVHTDRGTANVLINDGRIYSVNLTSLAFEEISVINNIDYSKTDDTDRALKELAKWGFDWSAQNIRKWIENYFRIRPLRITRCRASTILNHADNIIVGTYGNELIIYCNPYGPNGELKLYDSEPTASFDLNKILNIESRNNSIRQLDVIEILNGHRIIILMAYKIFTLDLTHTVDGETSIMLAVAGDLVPLKKSAKRQKV